MEGALQAAVGRNLRRARMRLGLSQEGLAEQIGWHRTYVGGVERGERNLTLQSVERLSDQLGLYPLDLLWDQENVAVVLDPVEGARFVKPPVPATSEVAERLTAADQRDGRSTPAVPSQRRRRPRPG